MYRASTTRSTFSRNKSSWRRSASTRISLVAGTCRNGTEKGAYLIGEIGMVGNHHHHRHVEPTVTIATRVLLPHVYQGVIPGCLGSQNLHILRRSGLVTPGRSGPAPAMANNMHGPSGMAE
jgi:hypothetical protein